MPTVVVVNDNAAQLKLLSATLEAADLDVRAFGSAQGALQALQDSSPPALIVTDLHMPGIDGWRFCRLLRSSEYPSLNAVPILVVSATFAGPDFEQTTTDLGAEAFLELPCAPEELRNVAGRLLEGHGNDARPPVLIVEDEETQAEILRRQFEALQHSVHVAYTADEARDLCREYAPETAIIDYHLPDRPGDELLVELQSDLPNMVAVMITGDSSSDLALRLMQKGADGYVRKPFEFDYLYDLCEKAHRQRQLLQTEQLLDERTRKLREQKEQYRRLIETSPDAVTVTDLDGTITFCNRQTARLHRFDSPKQMLGKSALELIAPEDHQRAEANTRKVLETGAVHSLEYTLLRADGTRFPAELSASLLPDAEGRPHRFIGVVRDISERKRAEDALADENAFREALIERAAEGICVCHETEEYPHVGFTVWNNRMTEITGYTMEEINRLGWYQTMYPDPDLQARAIERMGRMREGDDLLGEEWEVTRADGEKRVLSISTSVLQSHDGVVHVLAVMHDVTDRRRAEEAELHFQAQLTALHEIGNELSTVTTTDDLCRRAVQLGRERLGFDRLGIWFSDDDPAVIHGSYGVDESGELRDERQSRVRLVDDSVVERFRRDQMYSKLKTSVPLRDCHGEVVGRGDQAFAALRDGEEIFGFVVADNFGTQAPITHRQCELLALYASTIGHLHSRVQTEEKLRESETRHRLLAENVSDVIWTTDLDLRYTYFSPAVERMRGFTVEEALGQTIQDAVAPNSQGVVAQAIAEELAEEKVEGADPQRSRTIELELNCKDGSTLWTEITVTFLRDADGRPTGLLGVTRDISERRRIAQDLATEKERLATTLRSMGEGVIVANGDHRIVLINDAAQRLTGWSAEQAQGLSLDALAVALGASSGRELTVDAHSGTGTEVVCEGPPRRVLEVVANSLAEGPETGGWVLLVRDVTRERLAQQQLSQQSRLAAVGQLAAGIAHDFNNLLTGMVGFAELLALRDDLPESAKRHLQSIQTQGNRAAELIRQILDFSRKSITQRRPLNLVSLLKEIGKVLERTIEEHVKLTLDIESTAHRVNADATQVQQLLTNLAVNARDAMPKGGELGIRLHDLTVEPGEPVPYPGMAPGTWVVLEVADTGTGMPPDVLEHVFEPFFTTKEVGEGTGLGLAQVYGIVKQHKGYIDVDTEVGRGTTFTIYLPSVAEDEEAEEPAAPKPPTGGGESLLLVEDEPQVLEVLIAMLESLNYRVLSATNGKEAIEVYDQHREDIALVLTDMTMPELGGLDLYRALRRRDPGVKVVVISGYPLGETSDGLMEEGLLGWIEKPPTLPVLAEAVRVALEGSEDA